MKFNEPVLYALCDKVIVAIWSIPATLEGQCTITGSFGEAISPMSALRLTEDDGTTRLVMAFPKPQADALTLMLTAEGFATASIEYEPSLPLLDKTVFAGLSAPSRMSLVSALISSWPNLFKLNRNPGYLALLRSLLAAPEGNAGQAQPLLGAGETVAIETALPTAFGDFTGGFLVTSARIIPLKVTALVGQSNSLRRFLTDMPADAGSGLLVLRCRNGFALRHWTVQGRVPSPESWWKKSGGKDMALRQQIISLFNTRSSATAAASVEFQLRCPLQSAAVRGTPTLPSAQIELALTSQRGALVGGWFRDQGGFIDGFDVLGPNDTPTPIDAGRFEFSGRVADGENSAAPATGFVGFLPDLKGPLLQPRFLMRLKSGARHLLVPHLQPVDWTSARAAALRSVPPQALNDNIISTCLAPVIEEYQAAAKASVGAPVVKQIGTRVDHPLVSIVIPLYKVLDFLPFQIAAFASDPQVLFRCELIFVLDSPEQADVVEHMLTGLHLVYGIPITLAVMPRNGGYAIANNRAAALARGEALVLLNSDVIPIAAGWIGDLIARFTDPEIGAVGPKLLFEDDSIQHAGLYFDRDHRGRWLNHHFYKGMPRHYRPANEERVVPGVTGACLVTRRGLFEKVGGFTEDYVIGDYEDSDLCLKLRALGTQIAYVPSAELYHLERRSIRQSGDYMQGVASQYNSWLHQQRWGETMEALMAPMSKPAQTRRVA